MAWDFMNEDLKLIKKKDGKYYNYNCEVDNIYYCPNNIVIDKNGIHRFEHDKYIVLDYFILDLVNKKIYLYDKNIDDCFSETIGEIEKIDIVKTDYGKEIRITNKNNEVSIIEIDKENKIIGYINESIEKIGDNFLIYCDYLKKIRLPDVKLIDDWFLSDNKSLKEIKLPKAEKIGNNFLTHNEILKEISLPNVREIGESFLVNNFSLKEISLPNVRKIDVNFLYHNEKLKVLDVPNLLEVHPFQLHKELFKIVEENKTRVMKKLKVTKVDEVKYSLQDKDNNIYELYLEFHDIDNKIKVGDIIYLDEYLLNEDMLLAFGNLNSIYGKEIEDDKDIIIIESNNKRITLKRLYG